MIDILGDRVIPNMRDFRHRLSGLNPLGANGEAHLKDLIDNEIETLRAKIERLAPSDPDHREGRKEYYKRFEKVSKDNQKVILLTIFGCQINSDLIPQTEKAVRLERKIKEWVAEKEREHEKARKRYEYIQRQYSKGKVPKVKPPDPLLLVSAQPPHRKKDSSILNLWDLYIALKKAGLSPIYVNLKNILNYFLNEFIEIDSIKRELSHIKDLSRIRKDRLGRLYVKDTYYRDYVNLKIQSKKTPHKS